VKILDFCQFLYINGPKYGLSAEKKVNKNSGKPTKVFKHMGGGVLAKLGPSSDSKS
jgi:hypothetical protein